MTMLSREELAAKVAASKYHTVDDMIAALKAAVDLQQALADALDAGFDARIANLPVLRCPYALGSLARQRWLSGWGEADKLLYDLERKKGNIK